MPTSVVGVCLPVCVFARPRRWVFFSWFCAAAVFFGCPRVCLFCPPVWCVCPLLGGLVAVVFWFLGLRFCVFGCIMCVLVAAGLVPSVRFSGFSRFVVSFWGCLVCRGFLVLSFVVLSFFGLCVLGVSFLAVLGGLVLLRFCALSLPLVLPVSSPFPPLLCLSLLGVCFVAAVFVLACPFVLLCVVPPLPLLLGCGVSLACPLVLSFWPRVCLACPLLRPPSVVLPSFFPRLPSLRLLPLGFVPFLFVCPFSRGLSVLPCCVLSFLSLFVLLVSALFSPRLPPALPFPLSSLPPCLLWAFPCLAGLRLVVLAHPLSSPVSFVAFGCLLFALSVSPFLPQLFWPPSLLLRVVSVGCPLVLLLALVVPVPSVLPSLFWPPLSCLAPEPGLTFFFGFPHLCGVFFLFFFLPLKQGKTIFGYCLVFCAISIFGNNPARSLLRVFTLLLRKIT